MNIAVSTPEEIHGIDEKGEKAVEKVEVNSTSVGLTIESPIFRDGLLPFKVGVRKLTPTYELLKSVPVIFLLSN